MGNQNNIINKLNQKQVQRRRNNDVVLQDLFPCPLLALAAADVPADIQEAFDNHDTDFGLFSPAPPGFDDDDDASDDIQEVLVNHDPDFGLISPGPTEDDGTPDHIHDHDENEHFLDAGDSVEQNGSVAGMQAITALCISSI